MPVAVKGTGGGSVTLTAGAAATDTTLTLPNTTGTVALTASPTFTGTVTIPTLSVTGTSTLTGTVTATTITSPSATALTFQYGGTTGATLDTSGNLLVGTTSPSGKITINGSYTLTNQNYAYFALSGTSAVSGYITNQSSAYSLWASNRISAEEFNARSDARMKKEITPIPTTDAMYFINNVQAVHYKWKDSVEDGHKFGFLAQDIVKAGFPNLVGQYPSDNLPAETDADGFTSPEGVMMTVSYDQIIPLLSAAIKKLSAMNDALEARLAALEAK